VARSYFARLNGTIMFIPGGHDKWVKKTPDWADIRTATSVVEFLPPLYSLELKDERLMSGGRYLPIVLCHYAMRRWDRSHYGSICLHGHSHNKLPRLGRSMDVGVDCWDFYPVSLDRVIDELIGR